MLMEGITEGLRESSLSLQIVNLQQSMRADETFKQFFQRQGLQGVILRSFLQNRTTCKKILSKDFPSIVVGDRYDEVEDSNFVCCNFTGETAKAVQHLVDLGHKRIAFAMHRRADRDHLDRFHGFQQACTACDIEPDGDLVLHVIADFDGGQTALNRLMSLANPPTAIVFADPHPGIGAICRAHGVGLQIPRDLSIVGFDDEYTRKRIYPVLTAVCQDTQKLGMEAAVWRTKNLNGLSVRPCHQVIHAHLEINQTTRDGGLGLCRDAKFSTAPTRLGDVNLHRSNSISLYQKVAERSPDVTPVLFETWDRAPGHDFYEPPTPNFPGGPAQMQQEVRDGYLLAASDIDAATSPGTTRVAPVGDAWESLNWMVETENLHANDLYHAANPGILLAALTIYATIYQDDTADIDLSSVLTDLNLPASYGPALVNAADHAVFGVPEPSTFALLFLDGGGLLLRGRRTANRFRI